MGLDPVFPGTVTNVSRVSGPCQSCQPRASLVVPIGGESGNRIFQGGLWRSRHFYLSIPLLLMLPNTSQDTCSAGMHPAISGIIYDLFPELSKGRTWFGTRMPIPFAVSSGCPGMGSQLPGQGNAGEQASMWIGRLLENFYPVIKVMKSSLLLLSVLLVTSGTNLSRALSLPNVPGL